MRRFPLFNAHQERYDTPRIPTMSEPLPTDAAPAADSANDGPVAAALDKLRLRLLDLTLQNRLLNFRHTRRSALRVVDELPDALWERLRDGDELAFLPVPDPPAQEPPAQHKPTARDHAETVGLATSFDLPEPPLEGDKAKPAHRDKHIQTLHFPGELEEILRALAGSARSAIDETGSNMLFLVFGFLEWFETPASKSPLLAPLFTLPVTMRRGDVDPKTRTFRYHVSYSGEDPGFNVSLHEKMRRDFGVQVPVPVDDELPEAYFARVRAAAGEVGRWTVRRQVTLSILSFGKLLMYQDLEPSKWPVGKAPTNHPLVRDLLAGAERRFDVSGEYDLDAPEFRESLPPIVIDADSSQHSAIVDAMRGRNLVIQGPPGTGKSQTIANLIAAAMLSGKTVLFVAEKLAALEVVSRRLEAAGLGDFCLELHSHKTQKQEFLKDIGRRVEARGKSRDPSDLDAKLHVLREAQLRLSEYAQQLHAPFGASQRSAYDLLWERERRRAELGSLASGLEDAPFPDAFAWTLSDHERCREAVSAYAAHAAPILQHGGLASHPWAGVAGDLAGPDVDRTWAALAVEAKRCAGALCVEIQALPSVLGASADDPRDFLSSLIEALRSLPAVSPECDPVLPALCDANVRQHVSSLLDRLALQARFWAAIAPFVSRPLATDAEATALRVASAGLNGVANRARVLGEVERAAAEFDSLRPRLQAYDGLRGRVAGALGVELPATLRACSAAVEAAALARLAPIASLHVRDPAVDPEAADPAFRAALAEAQALWQVGSSLAAAFELQLLPDADTLKRHLGACVSAGLLRYFDAAYQDAARCFASLQKVRRDTDPKGMGQAFQQLATYAFRAAAFARNDDFRRAIGVSFRGMATPFQDLAAVRSWQLQVLSTLSSSASLGHSLAHVLSSASPEALRTLGALVPDPAPLRNELRSIADYLASSAGVSGPAAAAVVDTGLADLDRSLHTRGGESRAAAAQLLAAGFSPACELARVPSLVEALHAYLTTSRALQADDTPTAGGMPSFLGDSTRIAAAHAALAAFDAVMVSSLHEGAKSWLLQGKVSEKAANLRQLAQALASQLQALDVAHGAFVRGAGVDEALWYAGTGSWGGAVGVRTVEERSSRASAAADRLKGWCALLRARRSLAQFHLEFLADRAEAGELPLDQLPACCDFGVIARLARAALQASPVLSAFDGAAHDQVAERFRRYDKDVIEAFRARAAWTVDQRIVPDGVRTGPVSTHTELTLLEHECRKQRRHVPIRQLLRRAGHALQVLKPCFLMGPRSVAQYLEPGVLEFDLLVMDEASQLRPEDAFGAICRAHQVAIIGDPMQLPPTSFFDRMTDEGDTDDAELTPVDDAESILDVASAAYSPIRRLRWHYRSRHESLIAFSNAEFYQGQLVVFPSPQALSEDLGVHLEVVGDGVYEAGRNPREALRVAQRVVKHFAEHPGQSIGVAAMNFKQRDLIEDELQKCAKEDSAFREALDRSLAGPEPLFVKNLENVQGDERDVILVSVTYGKDPAGKLLNRFGPLNGASGPRRLNVLFTRAKRRIDVFCSFDPDELSVDATGAEGAAVLKRYLTFARSRSAGSVGQQAAPVSDFERSFQAALAPAGFDAVPRVGVVGSAIEVAVRSACSPGAFLLAVEGDGAAYRQACSVRDRDRLRRSALESMGWTLHQVWSAGWGRDPAGELARVLAKLVPPV